MSDVTPDPFEQSREAQIAGMEKRRAAVEFLRQFMHKSDDYRRPYLERADEASNFYECWQKTEKSQIHRANLRLPYAYLVVETETPAIASKFLNFKPPFKLKGRREASMAHEEVMTDFFAMQFEQMRFPKKLVPLVKSAAIRGTAVAKVPYRYDERVVTKRETVPDPQFGIPVPQVSRVAEILFDGPDLEFIPLEDFFPDWTVRTPADVQAMRGAAHRVYRTLEDLKAGRKKTLPDGTRVGVYERLEELTLSCERKGHDAWAPPYFRSENYERRERADEKKRPIELWEFWGSWRGKEMIITVANGDVVIRCEENFYDYKQKPFVATVNVPLEGEFYGASELFAIRGSVKEATALRNARLDQINLAVNRQWVVDRAAGINARSLYSRPNGIIWANDVKGIQPLPPPEVPPSAFREMQELTNEIQTTAASVSGPELSAAGRTFGRSATGANLVSNISGSRSGLKAKYMAETFMRDLVHLMMLMNAQYVTEEQWVRSNDPNVPNPFRELPRAAFHCDYDFEIVAGFDADPMEEFQRLQAAAPILQAAEASQPGVIDWEAYFAQNGRALFGRSFKKFTRSPEEMLQMQMQRLAGEQMVSAQVGAAAPQPNAPGGAKPPGVQ